MILLWLLACRRSDPAGEVEIVQPSPSCPFSRVVTVTLPEPAALRGTASDGEHERSFDRPESLVHVIELPALYADRTWTLELVSVGDAGETAFDPVSFTTVGLHDAFPEVDVRVRIPERMEPGLTLLPVTSVGVARYLAAFDDEGEVAWVFTAEVGRFLEVRIEGDRMFLHHDNEILLIDWMGRMYARWTSELAPNAGIPIPVEGLHHELLRTEGETFLTMTQSAIETPRMPVAETSYGVIPRMAPTVVAADALIEVTPVTGSVVGRWELLDILDPERIGFSSLKRVPLGVDWTHANAVEEDVGAHAWVVSARHQDAVVSFDKATSEINWIAGNPANWREPWASALLTPVGDDFDWFWHQHAIKWRPEDGSLLLFDNGNFRSAPFTGIEPLDDDESWSRVASYHLDLEARTIERTWYFDVDPPLYSEAMGDADWLPNGNVLATYAFVSYEDHVRNSDVGRLVPSIRVVEIDPATNEVVWDLDLWADEDAEGGWQSFRSTRVPSFDIRE
ncbi:MAG: aryl-sulfate sulfotransferase [Deltaproteobacteria bacterium]|nr:aryl-sulfate sulfotransferase [Deltaproteobacteria bacterium]